MSQSSVISHQSSVKKRLETIRGRISHFYYYLATSFYLLPSAVLAQATPPPPGKYNNPITFQYNGQVVKTIPEFLLALVDLAFLIAMPIIVVFLVYSGFLFLTAGDNEANVTKAKKVFLWCLVGATIAIGAKVLAAVIQATIIDVGTVG